jgi:6-pyruvoyl-tetrahydropterin synthase
MSEIKWDANYDGKNAHVLLNINKDGKKQKIDMNLDNSDLAKLLNIPTVNEPLDERLMLDFVSDNQKTSREMPQMIELPIFEQIQEQAPPTPYTHISSPRSFEEFIKPLTISAYKHRKTQKLTKVRKSKSKSNSKSKSKTKTKSNRAKYNSKSSIKHRNMTRKHSM